MRRKSSFLASLILSAVAPTLVYAQANPLPIEELEPSTVVVEPAKEAMPQPPIADPTPVPLPPPAKLSGWP